MAWPGFGDISMAAILALPAFCDREPVWDKASRLCRVRGKHGFNGGAVFQPVGLITLPKLSSILSEGRNDEARSILQKTITYTAIISFVVTIALFLSAKYVVHYWLGPQFDEATGIVRLAMLAAVPNALFIALRSSIDAANVKAVNAGNIYKALVVSALAYLMVKAATFQLPASPCLSLLGWPCSPF